MKNKMYDLFFDEYLTEATNEIMMKAVKAADEEAEKQDKEEKKLAYKENYYMKEKLQNPYVTPILAKENTRERMVEFVGTFLNDHSKELGTSGPVHMFTFGEKEINFLYNLFGVDSEFILKLYNELIDETYFGTISLFITGWIKNAPHKMLLSSITIDAAQHGYDDIIECCEYLWAFCDYPILYKDYWSLGVKEDVMRYTIEHLSSKFKIKKTKNLQEFLKNETTDVMTFMMDRLKTGADNTYIDFIYRIRTQLNNKFRNISREYYKNSKNNASTHIKDTEFDDGTLTDQEGYNTNATQIIDNTISKIKTGNLNKPLISVAANGSQVDKDNLSGYLSQIFSTKNNKLEKLVENIIMAYFDKYNTNNSIVSNEFLNFGLAMYKSIGTSKNSLYVEIKSILDVWMFDIIDIKKYYQREPTWIAYRRAIFNYIIFIINYYN